MRDRIEEYLLEINKKQTGEKIVLARRLNTIGRLHFGNELMGSIGSMIEELQFVFPDRWDIQFERQFVKSRQHTSLSEPYIFYKKTMLKAEFVIHFPVIEITNTKEMKHAINDLYVKLISDVEKFEGEEPQKLTIKSFRGKRMSATKDEIMCNYQHSHLPGKNYVISTERYSYGQNSDTIYSRIKNLTNDFTTYQKFCTGVSEINNITAMLVSRYDANTFKMFLMQLDLYLGWESIEGRPHRYMKDVIGKAEANDVSTRACKEFFEKIPKEKTDIDFTIKSGDIKIVDNEKFEDFLKYKKSKNFRDYKPDFTQDCFCYKDELGEYFSIRVQIEDIPDCFLSLLKDLASRNWYFKGNLIEFKLLQEKEITEEVNKPFYVHYKIKEYARTRIEESIKTSRFRSHIIEELSKISNT